MNRWRPIRTFANGAIRVASLSTEEPAAASEHLLIHVRSKEGIGDGCFAVSARDGEGYVGGFYTLDFANSVRPTTINKGCRWIPASVNDSGEGKPVGEIKVRISPRTIIRLRLKESENKKVFACPGSDSRGGDDGRCTCGKCRRDNVINYACKSEDGRYALTVIPDEASSR